MGQWVSGNIPKDTDIFYWLTLKGGTKRITYHLPCKYDAEQECWINTEGVKLDSHIVVAYYPIKMPEPYSYLGTGFYIRTWHKEDEFIYGFKLQFADWAENGYQTKEKAIAAAKRKKKTDQSKNNEADKYEVLDENGEVVWQLKL